MSKRNHPKENSPVGAGRIKVCSVQFPQRELSNNGEGSQFLTPEETENIFFKYSSQKTISKKSDQQKGVLTTKGISFYL